MKFLSDLASRFFDSLVSGIIGFFKQMHLETEAANAKTREEQLNSVREAAITAREERLAMEADITERHQEPTTDVEFIKGKR